MPYQSVNQEIRNIFMKKLAICILLCLLIAENTFAWGFYAHRRINRLAVYTLPVEMIRFYKFYVNYISENAVNPDKRRYAVDGEAPRHYIDIDAFDSYYNDSAVYKMPRNWEDAVAAHSEDSLQAYGIVPWHINVMKQRLTQAFRKKNVKEILRLSADLGHYIGDANVPLHTTINYNGQLTNQLGIHAFWESRLPELYAGNYNFFVGRAAYLENPQLTAWEAVVNAHNALDSVLNFERLLTEQFSKDRKFTFEERNRLTVRTYARPFCQSYHRMLDGQVEKRMRAAIKMVGDFWYTCWVDAGQPDLNDLLDEKNKEDLQKEIEKEEKEWRKRKIKSRPHEGFSAKNSHRNCCQDNPYLVYYRRRLQEKKENDTK